MTADNIIRADGHKLIESTTAGSNRFAVQACRMSGLGVLLDDRDLCLPWIQSTQRLSAGNLRVNIVPGIFTDRPVCAFTVRDPTRYCTFNTNPPTQLSFFIQCRRRSDRVLVDVEIFMICAGETQ